MVFVSAQFDIYWFLSSSPFRSFSHFCPKDDFCFRNKLLSKITNFVFFAKNENEPKKTSSNERNKKEQNNFLWFMSTQVFQFLPLFLYNIMKGIKNIQQTCSRGWSVRRITFWRRVYFIFKVFLISLIYDSKPFQKLYDIFSPFSSVRSIMSNNVL